MKCAASWAISAEGRPAPIIVEGLKKLEYRGYDSFGVATISGGIESGQTPGKDIRFIKLSNEPQRNDRDRTYALGNAWCS